MGVSFRLQFEATCRGLSFKDRAMVEVKDAKYKDKEDSVDVKSGISLQMNARNRSGKRYI